MRTKPHRPALIEGLEQRVLFDASQITESIVSSTLPASVSDLATLKGVVSVQLTNSTGTAQKFKGTLAVDAANQTLDIPSNNFVNLRSIPASISLNAGQTKVFKVAISLASGKLTDGSYNLFGVLTDSTSASSQSPAGPALLVRKPDISLTETETFKKLPASLGLNAVLKAVDTVKITNKGTDPFAGFLKVSILAAPDDTVAGSTTATFVAKKYTLAPNHTITVPIKFTSTVGLAANIYRMLSAATLPDGTITSSDPASAPTFTVIAPATDPNFVPTIQSATPVYASDSNPANHHITQLNLSMSIQNKGAVSIGSDQFVLFASTKPTFDNTAINETPQPLTLTLNEYQGSNSPFQIDVDIPDNTPNNGTPVTYYIFVQITDTSGGVSMASFATPISFAGPVSG